MPRVFTELANARRVLLAGAGGGFDVYAGLPLYAGLRRQGCEVWLANLSFTSLAEVKGPRPTKAVVEISSDSAGPENYFPERSLARFLERHDLGTRIFAFEKTGVVSLREAYAHLVAELEADTVILVDGGTDLLMRGDERGLGTPTEDMTSLAAVRSLELPRAIACCIGFGIDSYHGVRHAQFLENVAALSRTGAYWGSVSMTTELPEVRLYLDAVQHAAGETNRPSIVNGCIADAIAGAYGDVHRHPDRTRGSTLWVNPLMSLMWSFDLYEVARSNLYLDDLEGTQGVWDVQLRIEAARERIPRRDSPVDIPA